MNEENKVNPGSANPMQKEIDRFIPKNIEKKPAPGTQDAPVSIPQVQKLDPNLVQKPIRTFESDLAEALAKKQGGTAAISIAENKKKFEEARQAEAGGQAGAPTPQRVYVRPVSPTNETAIPGAAIPIPPTVPRGDVNAEIAAALKASRPPEPPKSKFTPPSAVIKTPVQMPVVTPLPQPQVKTAPAVQTQPRRSALKPFLLTIVSILLIGGGLFEGYLLYQKNIENAPVDATPSPIVLPSLLPKDNSISLSIGSEQGDNLISKINGEFFKTNVTFGKITELRIWEQKNGAPSMLTSSAFFDKLNTHIPNVITRSLTDRWMLGIYGEENGQKTTFMALTTDFFQNIFAGMLSWEDNSMADDLALLLNFKNKTTKVDPTSTTTNIASFFGIRGSYSDKVIRNRDVREFRTPDGQLLFLYSFINKETLIITTTESSFMALVDRVDKEAYVR